MQAMGPEEGGLPLRLAPPGQGMALVGAGGGDAEVGVDNVLDRVVGVPDGVEAGVREGGRVPEDVEVPVAPGELLALDDPGPGATVGPSAWDAIRKDSDSSMGGWGSWVGSTGHAHNSHDCRQQGCRCWLEGDVCADPVSPPPLSRPLPPTQRLNM